MAATYPMELREKVMAAYDRGVGGSVKLAALFGVSRAWICNLLQQRRETGSIAPKEYRRGRKPKLSEAQRVRLVRVASEHPDLTLEETRRKARLRCSHVTVWRELTRAGFTFKRNRSKLANSSAMMSSKRGGVGDGG